MVKTVLKSTGGTEQEEDIKQDGNRLFISPGSVHPSSKKEEAPHVEGANEDVVFF